MVFKYYNCCYNFYEFDEKHYDIAKNILFHFDKTGKKYFWDEKKKDMKNITQIYYIKMKDEIMY